jgi:hypothetical protein
MTLKQSNYKSITALLLILVIAVGAVWAPLYVEASHGHDCSGTACPVCLTVSVIGSCLNYVLPALLPLLLCQFRLKVLEAGLCLPVWQG